MIPREIDPAHIEALHLRATQPLEQLEYDGWLVRRAVDDVEARPLRQHHRRLDAAPGREDRARRAPLRRSRPATAVPSHPIFNTARTRLGAGAQGLRGARPLAAAGRPTLRRNFRSPRRRPLRHFATRSVASNRRADARPVRGRQGSRVPSPTPQRDARLLPARARRRSCPSPAGSSCRSRSSPP